MRLEDGGHWEVIIDHQVKATLKVLPENSPFPPHEDITEVSHM